MSEPKVTVRRWSGVDGEAAEALLDELSESPLPGARYARDVVRRRLPALRSEAAHEARTELLREVRGAQDRMVDEVREGTRTLSDAYREDADGAKRWAAAVDRIQLAVAAFANEVATLKETP